MSVGPEPADEFSEEGPGLLERFQMRFLRNQLTTVQLKWVAVNAPMHSKGIGTLLMGHAIDGFYEIIDRTGVSALTLKPINENAKTFYESVGFSVYGKSGRMILPADAVLEARDSEA